MRGGEISGIELILDINCYAETHKIFFRSKQRVYVSLIPEGVKMMNMSG